MENKNINITDELLVMYITKSADNITTEKVESWLKESQDNTLYFNELEKIWNSSANVKNFENFNTEESLFKVKKRLNINSDKKQKSIIRKLIPYIAVAASILLIIGLYYFLNQKTSNIIDIESFIVESTTDNKLEVKLPDGTIAYLNENSKISYPEKFGNKTREIKFEGEAYFIVSPDKSKPFVISTEKSYVKVVGTEFNLRAISNENIESIIVSEGIVIYGDAENEKNNVEITVGEKAIISKSDKKIIKETNSDENFLSWKTGIFIFNDKPLKDVIKTVSDYYNVEFVIENSEIENMILTTKYDNLKIDEVLSILELTLNLKIEEQNGKFIVSK